MDASLSAVLQRLRACRWVDLTHAFAPGIPHYHAFPDEQRTTLFGFEEGEGRDGAGFLAHEYRHIGQWGTHVDPPGHFTRGGRLLDAIAVEEMILELVVLDVRAAAAGDPDHVISPADVRAHEERHGPIPAGAFVAANLGWSARWPDPDAMANRDGAGVAHHPGWGVEALELLVAERGVTAVGHDTTDTDPGRVVSGGTAPAETYLLGADRWQIELLANLDDLPATGALVVAAWPKPQDGSGFPARVFAIVPTVG
jgi:kynurenine formamidase